MKTMKVNNTTINVILLLILIQIIVPELMAQSQWQPKLDMNGVAAQAAQAGTNWKAIISWGIQGSLVVGLLYSVNALNQNKPNAKEYVIGFLFAIIFYNICWMLI